MAIEKFELKLVAVKQLSPNTKHFAFVRADGKPLAFVPGQFVTVLFPHPEGIKRRSYSLANSPGAETLELAVSYVKGGVASEILFNLAIGQTLAGLGPAGKLVLPEEPINRIILVGTGTGVAPYRAMLPALSQRLAKEPTASVCIIQGVQYRHDVLYGEDFLAFANAHAPRTQFFTYLSRETSALVGHERKGYVQNHFAELALKPTSDIVYLCGNPNMIDQAFAMLQAQGLPSENIRREKYISSN